MRGMSIRIKEGLDPDGSPAWCWEVKFFKKTLGMGYAVERSEAEKAAAMALGVALSKQIITSRDRDRAKAKLGQLCETRPYLSLGVSRIIMRDGNVERVLREASQEEAATYEETPKALRLIGLPTDPRARDPREAAERLIQLAVKAGLLAWKEEGVLEARPGFKNFMVRQFGREAFGLPMSEEELNVQKALETLGKAKAKTKKKKIKKGKTRKDENEDDYPAMGEL